MTSESIVEPRTFSGSNIKAPSLWVLGRREARRIVASPVYAVVLGFILLMSGMGGLLAGMSVPSASEAYEGIFYVLALYAGLLTYMAAHLVTSSSRRSRADRQLASLPLAGRPRGGGLSLGVILGPGVVAGVLAVLLRVLESAVDKSLIDVYGVSGLTQVTLVVVGGGLFGVLTATWLRFPGSLPVGLVLLVFATLAMMDANGPFAGTLPWFAPYLSAPGFADERWTLTGSQWFHTVYLVGLCALAICGVMLREPDGRRRWLIISSGVVVATGLVGWVQL